MRKMLHGVYLAGHKFLINRFGSLASNSFFNSKLGRFVSIAITQYLVILAWIPFRVEDTNEMIFAIKKFIILDLNYADVIAVILNEKLSFGIIILFIVLHYISYKRNIVTWFAKLSLKYWFLMILFSTLTILLFYNGNPEDFVYFKF